MENETNTIQIIKDMINTIFKPKHIFKCPKCEKGECPIYFEYIDLVFSCGHRYRVRIDKLLKIAEPIE